MGIDAEMFVVSPREMSDAKISHLSWCICEAFGHGKFLVSRERGTKALSRATDEDVSLFPFAVPDGSVTIIRCNLFGRFYGIGYERGDLPVLLAVARWLKANVPQAVVFYGGDTGCELIRLDDEAHQRLWRHFCEVGHEPYLRGFDDRAHRYHAVCKFCDHGMRRVGFGGADDSFAIIECDGCGLTLQTRNKGALWTNQEGREPFKDGAPVDAIDEIVAFTLRV